MFIKQGEGYVLSMVKDEELTEEQKKLLEQFKKPQEPKKPADNEHGS